MPPLPTVHSELQLENKRRQKKACSSHVIITVFPGFRDLNIHLAGYLHSDVSNPHYPYLPLRCYHSCTSRFYITRVTTVCAGNLQFSRSEACFAEIRAGKIRHQGLFVFNIKPSVCIRLMAARLRLGSGAEWRARAVWVGG